MHVYMTSIEDNKKAKFEKLYVEYRQAMFHVANSILKDEQLSQDAVHEAFLKLIKYLDKIDEIKCYKTEIFLDIIVKNISINIYNKRNKENNLSFDEVQNYIYDENSNVERKLLSKFEYDKLVQSIMDLPLNYSNVLLLKYIHGYSDDEIADILDISKENVRKRAERGRKKLLKIIQKGSNTDGDG